MFVTTPGMDNFDCPKMNAHFKKFTACLQEGPIHEWKQALLAPPLPLISLNNSRLCSTHKHLSAFFSTYRSTNNILRILALKALDHGHLLDLAYDRKTCAYPVSAVLATVAFLLLVDTSLLSDTRRLYALLTAIVTTALRCPKRTACWKFTKTKSFISLDSRFNY